MGPGQLLQQPCVPLLSVNLSISALRDPLASISVPRPLDDTFRKKVTGTRRDVIPSQVVQVCFKVAFERSVAWLFTAQAKQLRSR